MPLIDAGPPKLWHWQQVIGWIAFDLVEPPVGFNIFYNQLQDRIPERAKRKELAFRALDELIDAVEAGAVNCVWRDDHGSHPPLRCPQSQERMQGMLDVKLSIDSSIFRNLYFYREAILQHWPRSERAQGTIFTERNCEQWLRKLARIEELEKPLAEGGTVPAKRYWFSQAKSKFEGLSRRAFDRAWANVAQDYPGIAGPGRKRVSSRKSPR